MISISDPRPNGTMPRSDTGASSNSPRIVPHRQVLHDRLLVLPFSIETRGKPYYEVLVTTDRALFSPERAAARSDRNFYASSQDAQLLAADAHPVFLVPAGVLRNLTQIEPRPNSIFYTMIAYDSPDGANPTFALPPESLPQAAPSVRISPSFRGRPLATVLGVPIDKLRRVGADGRLIDRQLAASSQSAKPDISSAVDAAEGEDGMGVPESPASESSLDWTAAPLDLGHTDDADGEDACRLYEQQGAHDIGDPSPAVPAPAAWGERPPAVPPYAEPPDSRAQQSLFPPEMPEPQAIEFDEGELPYEDGFGEEVSSDDLFAEDRYDDDQYAGDQFAGDQYAEDQYAEDQYRRNAHDTNPDDEGLFEESSQQASASSASGASYRDEADQLDFEDLGENELSYESLEETDLPAENSTPPAALRPLEIEDRVALIELVGEMLSGADGYRAARFTPHDGLRFGIVGFRQSSGELGALLQEMNRADGDLFERVFGPSSEELIQVTTARDAAARLNAVGGAGLSDRSWLERFREAGQQRSFQSQQNRLASSLYIDPLLRFAAALRISSQRGLTLAVVLAVELGVAAAKQWIADAARVLSTPAEQQAALEALGQADVGGFQQIAGLPVDGQWNADTRVAAAAAAALRRLGHASPVPLPGSGEEVLRAVVQRAAAQSLPMAEVLRQLYANRELDGALFDV